MLGKNRVYNGFVEMEWSPVRNDFIKGYRVENLFWEVREAVGYVAVIKAGLKIRSAEKSWECVASHEATVIMELSLMRADGRTWENKMNLWGILEYMSSFFNEAQKQELKMFLRHQAVCTWGLTFLEIRAQQEELLSGKDGRVELQSHWGPEQKSMRNYQADIGAKIKKSEG